MGEETNTYKKQKPRKEKRTSEEEPITTPELKQIIEKPKNDKAPGGDKLTTEMFRNLNQTGMTVLLEICNTVWHKEQMPEEWKTTFIVRIYKHENRHDCINYRGKTSLCTAIRIYEQVVCR